MAAVTPQVSDLAGPGHDANRQLAVHQVRMDRLIRGDLPLLRGRMMGKSDGAGLLSAN
jgi:hypothetical protein